jgi:DNA repair protein RadC
MVKLMPISDWPIADRPREKLLQKGEQTLTDAELIAIFLQTGTRGKTALDIARGLLTEHGDLKTLLRLPAHTLLQSTGLGHAKYAALKAAIELGRRFLNDSLPVGEVLNSSQKTLRFMAAELREHHNEVFACAFLDNQCRLLSFEKLFEGTVHSTHVYPREIVKRGLAHNAAKIILAHNHPSGHASPSQADKDTTRLIKEAVALVDIDIIDHIIIGNPGHFSFADEGEL